MERLAGLYRIENDGSPAIQSPPPTFDLDPEYPQVVFEAGSVLF